MADGPGAGLQSGSDQRHIADSGLESVAAAAAAPTLLDDIPAEVLLFMMERYFDLRDLAARLVSKAFKALAEYPSLYRHIELPAGATFAALAEASHVMASVRSARPSDPTRVPDRDVLIRLASNAPNLVSLGRVECTRDASALRKLPQRLQTLDLIFWCRASKRSLTHLTALENLRLCNADPPCVMAWIPCFTSLRRLVISMECPPLDHVLGTLGGMPCAPHLEALACDGTLLELPGGSTWVELFGALPSLVEFGCASSSRPGVGELDSLAATLCAMDRLQVLEMMTPVSRAYEAILGGQMLTSLVSLSLKSPQHAEESPFVQSGGPQRLLNLLPASLLHLQWDFDLGEGGLAGVLTRCPHLVTVLRLVPATLGVSTYRHVNDAVKTALKAVPDRVTPVHVNLGPAARDNDDVAFRDLEHVVVDRRAVPRVCLQAPGGLARSPYD